MKPNQRYTYEDAGFNGLMHRSMKSNATANNLRGASRGSGAGPNFSLQQIKGTIGDHIQVGKIDIDGTRGLIAVNDDADQETIWLGNLES